jgi:hypothetical protein
MHVVCADYDLRDHRGGREGALGRSRALGLVSKMGSGMRVRFVFAALISGVIAIASSARAEDRAEAEKCANAAEESQGLHHDGKLMRAREQLLVCARPSCPAIIRKDCADWLVEVERNLPSIVVRAVDGNGKDLADVRVSVDGNVVAERLDGRPLSIDPGEHAIRYESPGAAPVMEKILVRQGETNRLVSVSLSSAKDRRPTATASSGSVPAYWFVGGAGVVLAGVGAALWLSGTGDHSSMESGCARTQSCSQSDVDSANT